MKKAFAVLLCVGFLLGATVASADDDWRGGGGWHEGGGGWHGGIHARIHATRERIERGVEQGRLSRHDAHRFMERLRAIDEEADRMREEGAFDPQTRAQINEELNDLNRDISIEKHEHDSRY